VKGNVSSVVFSSEDDRRTRDSIREHGLGFTLEEARSLAKLLGRDPTILEAHLFDAMWSEHCSYKSSRPTLKEFLPTEGRFVILGPSEDAGVVEIGTHEGVTWAAVIGHESHNHPSQIVPYEGAATGIGGIVRDVYCMGADVFGVLDSLRFGDLEGENAERCREILHGVVDGIAGYANPLGVPNLGGETVFHPGYDDNCLVNVIAVGVMPKDALVHSAVPEHGGEEIYDFVLVGKGTDASGFGGAAMASRILDEGEDPRSAVQVPDPFLKRVLRNATLEALARAKSRGVKIGLKDLGAGGIACVASEMAHAGGAGVEIDLEAVHLQVDSLPPEVIACAETQERFGWAVPRSFTKELLAIYNEDYELPRVSRGARASVIGRFSPESPIVRFRFRGEVMGEARAADITAGVVAKRVAAAAPLSRRVEEVEFDGDLHDLGLRVLASPNIASKRELFSHYDQEVRGAAFFRPGEADAGVALPVAGAKFGVALACDGNPRYGAIDAYWGGANAVVEAVRNVVATGARPRALTDCLNFGNPEKPEVFRDFREAVRGMADAARGLGTLELEGDEPLPFVSGNVSLYNESSSGRAVPPSPIVCCLGVVVDASRAVGSRLRAAGDLLFLVGERKVELGGSEVARLLGQEERGTVPEPSFALERRVGKALLRLAEAGRIAACHDVSSGGLLTCLAEMMLGSWGRVDLGLDIDIAPLAGRCDFEKLFSESGAYLIEIASDAPIGHPSPAKTPGEERAADEFADLTAVPCVELGRVVKEKRLLITGEATWAWEAAELERAWGGSFRKLMDSLEEKS
jgi:phosphoribosylformylglycinamidine synthase